jgi:hypothetical protein
VRERGVPFPSHFIFSFFQWILHLGGRKEGGRRR